MSSTLFVSWADRELVSSSFKFTRTEVALGIAQALLIADAGAEAPHITGYRVVDDDGVEVDRWDPVRRGTVHHLLR